ncbi:unnamed protein product [Protopolystoma xenopodis]|uniref:Uncharacterized protein n=1 Tax=Protopolystoma xenopodis TaxID=117903 RepID=A0A448WGZ4_9PLAT|nr:unnamed protein product [Protopolystoma xenopodis]
MCLLTCINLQIFKWFKLTVTGASGQPGRTASLDASLSRCVLVGELAHIHIPSSEAGYALAIQLKGVYARRMRLTAVVSPLEMEQY